MTDEQIIEMAKEAGLFAGPIYRDGLLAFANLVAEKIYAEQLELPKPRLTGKFSITAKKFKCTGCTGVWTNSEDAKQHSCKDYQ